FREQGMDDIVVNHLKLQTPEPDMVDWIKLVDRVKTLKHSVEVAIVGKYVELHDAYLSIVEALEHAGIEANSEVKIRWVNAEEVTDENVNEILGGIHGILVPGGFGDRGIEGKVSAIRYAREQKIPFFGICLGMQVAVIEYARSVVKLIGANSSEINPATEYPVIDLLPEQKDVEDMGGTMRLGLYPCKLQEDSLAMQCYNDELVYERHRHRYEFNNEYREAIEAAGLKVSGTSPDGRLVEIVECPEHPWFLAVQFHPEFTSRPNRPQPLFQGFVNAALTNKN
ncbi:MAG: CTP synthase, partial [Paenibacillus sp.]|nr:CTP synthase [Paenibacillus sp.]